MTQAPHPSNDLLTRALRETIRCTQTLVAGFEKAGQG